MVVTVCESLGRTTMMEQNGGAAEKMLLSEDSPEAVIDCAHWKRKQGTAQRGDEWYVFDERSGRIRAIRAHYAAPAFEGVPIGELDDFDYAGRRYHLRRE